MTTLAELAARAQAALDDVAGGTWSAERVRAWCLEGVRAYSQHYPRTRSTTLTTSAGQQTYALPADALGVLGVEYPTGQSPPRLLGQAYVRDDAFYARDDLYLPLPSNDATQPLRLHLSAVPPDGATVAVDYTAAHALDLAADDVLTVPGDHEFVLVAFVFWMATRHLLSAAQQAPASDSSLLMGQLAENARAAERAWRDALAALRAPAPAAALAVWRW